MCCDPAGHGGRGRSSGTSRGACSGVQVHLARIGRWLWRILSAIYVRHDGQPLHSTALRPFPSTSVLIREVIYEAERICREAA
jgi:hypothetical protein